MERYSFKSDYNNGACKRILDVLYRTNDYEEEGYGLDSFSEKASALIKEIIGRDDVDVHFVSGGTQANLIVIDAFLKSYESVIAPSSGHINVHECGAVEFVGHKINPVETDDGKIRSDDIKTILDLHSDEHMVKPRLVYISNATEVGTVYTKEELKNLYHFCKENGLFLYLDGARLGSALVSKYSDISLKDIADYTDAFYIGGTKNGALFGEAIVIKDDNSKKNFRYQMKQKGALLAKGRFLGIQFVELFKDDLFFNLARHANGMAYMLSSGIRECGYDFLYPVQSNQIFPIFPDKLVDKLYEKFDFYIWKRIDDNHLAVRLVTSWATSVDAVNLFIDHIRDYG